MNKIYVLTGIFTAACSIQAATVDVTLGQSAQNFVQYGLGADASGHANWDLQQGLCGLSGGSTTCTLSGSFTGSSAGFTGGSYSFVTTYAGTNMGALRGVSEAAPNRNYFNYSYLDPSVSIALNLMPTNGSPVTESLIANGAFVDPAFSFANTGTYACSGTAVATCDPYDVGITAGAIGQAPVITSVSFDVSSTVTPPPSTTPEPRFLGLLGLALLSVVGFKFRRKQSV